MSRQGTYRPRTYDNIKAFWDAEAAAIGRTPQVTIRDHYFRLHELHVLLPLIPICDRLLDAGCGTGFGTLVLGRRARYTLGIDHAAEMVRWANELKHSADYRGQIAAAFSPLWALPGGTAPEPSVDFMQADVLDLHLAAPPFDVITAQRLLINMPSAGDQVRALAQLRECAAANAWLLLTEATVQGHQRTDAYRARFGLPALEKYWHNTYVDEASFPEWRRVGWRVEHHLGFATYMLLSKVIYPAACGPESCAFLSGANAAAMEVASLFRSRSAVAEIGVDAFLAMYVTRVRVYDQPTADAIAAWIERHGTTLPDWSDLGHQRLLIARAC